MIYDMIKYKILFLLCFSLLISCSDSNIENELHLNFKELKIDIGSNSLVYYHSAYSILISSEDYFVGYNRFDHTFDYFNLNSSRVDRKLDIITEGENAILHPITSFAANENFIVVSKSLGKFYVLNHQGEVVSKFSSDDFYFLSKNNLSFHYSGLVFSNYKLMSLSKDNVLALMVFPSLPRSDENYYDHYNVALIPLNNIQDTKFIQLDYPETVSINYGDLDRPEIIFGHDTHVISSFSCSNEISFIPAKSNKIVNNVLLDIPSNEFRPVVIPQYNEKDYNGRWEYLKNSSRLFPLVFDPYQELYFRVLKLASSDIAKEKPNFKLLVYDMELNIVLSQDMPKNLDVQLFPTSNGLLIPYNEKHYSSEDQIEFLIVRVIK
jgi:hypothetical protein